MWPINHKTCGFKKLHLSKISNVYNWSFHHFPSNQIKLLGRSYYPVRSYSLYCFKIKIKCFVVESMQTILLFIRVHYVIMIMIFTQKSTPPLISVLCTPLQTDQMNADQQQPHIWFTKMPLIIWITYYAV